MLVLISTVFKCYLVLVSWLQYSNTPVLPLFVCWQIAKFKALFNVQKSTIAYHSLKITAFVRTENYLAG